MNVDSRAPAAAEVDAGFVEIRTTFGDRASAEACARRLVETRVAACVQVDGPITSTYAWRGAVETATEWRCTCKTTASRAADCRAAIVTDHPYETPEVVEAPVAVAGPYAAWLRTSVDG